MTEAMPILDCAKNGRDFGQGARLVHNTGPQIIAGDGQGDGEQFAAVIVGHKSRHAAFGVVLQIQAASQCRLNTALAVASLPLRARKKSVSPTTSPRTKTALKTSFDTGENMGVGNQRGINGNLDGLAARSLCPLFAGTGPRREHLDHASNLMV